MEQSRAKILNLQSSYKFLLELESFGVYKIQSNYPTIDGNQISILKGNRCLTFKTSGINSKPGDPAVNYQADSYGFIKTFYLLNDKTKVKITKGVSSFQYDTYKSEITGEIKHLESSISLSKVYHRALYPLHENDEQFLSFIESAPFTINDTLFPRGLIELSDIDIQCDIFRCKMSDKVYLIIDTKVKVEMGIFENILESILYNFALISGCLIRNERFILQSNQQNHEHISGFKYDSLKDTIKGMKVIDPSLFLQIHNTSKRAFLGRDIFKNLVKFSLNNPNQLRAISLLVESARYPSHIRASTYSVSLETVKNLIIDDFSDQISPIKTKQKAREIRAALKATLDTFNDETIFNNKKILYGKIEHINNVPNTDALSLVFKQIGISLTTIDIECISYRNDFLHGRLPAESNNEYKMDYVVYKLYLLVCALMLKRAGYNGYLLDYAVLNDMFRYKIQTNEPLFRLI